MKNLKNIILLTIALILISFSFNGCNGFGSPEFTLNVILEDGCTGTPEAGTYTMNELDTIEYEYFPAEENVQIEVFMNSSYRGSSGTLIMYNNVTMIVRIIDVRDDWEFSYYIEDSSKVEMTITFAGDTPFAGTFSDSRGYSGTWTVESDSFVMTYDDWADYVFTGSVTSMSGDYIGEGIQLGWTAARID